MAKRRYIVLVPTRQARPPPPTTEGGVSLWSVPPIPWRDPLVGVSIPDGWVPSPARLDARRLRSEKRTEKYARRISDDALSKRVD